MSETRIHCPEWTTAQDTETNTQNRCRDVKHNPARCFTTSKCHALRFLLLFLVGGGLLGFVLMTSSDNGEIHKRNPFPKKHRDKRQSGTCNVDMCLTQECIHAASAILHSMDTTVDPCEDFYQYTCGGWIQENKHRTGLQDLFYAINHNSLPEKVDLTLNELLKQNLPIPEEFMDTKPYQNLYTFHESCMLVSHTPGGEAEVLDVLRNLTEFQIGRPFDQKSWNLTKAVLELMRINGAPLFDVIIQSDIKNSKRYGIHITPPRRYGLIPALLGPKIPNPGVEQYFRLKNLRTVFDDLSDNDFMLELFSVLDSEKAAGIKAAHMKLKSKSMGNFEEIKPSTGQTGSINGVINSVGKPSVNVLPTDNFLEKETIPAKVPPTTTAPETILGAFTTTEQAPTANIVNESTSTPAPSIKSTQFPTTTNASFLANITTQPPTTSFPFISSEVPPNPTELGPQPYESTEFTDYETDDEYSENLKKIVSRKAIFKLFKRNLEKKRTESIATTVQNFFSNFSDESLLEFENYQPDDIYSTVMDHFVPLLDEIQPTEQEELIAQQHALLYNHFTVDQLQELTPMIEWNYLLSELFGKNITDEDNIYVFHPSYMTQLNHLLTALDPWVVHYGMVALYAYDVLKEAAVVSPEDDREDFCLQATKNVFGDVMSHMYLHHVGNKTIVDLRKHASTIIETLRDEVRTTLTESTWLTPADRSVALNKLNALQAEVAASDRHWDMNYINESHDGIYLSSEDSFLSNVMSIYRTFRKELYNVYHKPIDRDELIWSFTVQPFIVNAFHMQTTNTIVFPEAFFKNPYYSKKAPEYMNYGSTGTSIAHEIFHGLDFTGTLFDRLGVLSRPFSNASRFHLRETVDCYHRLLTDTFYEEVPVEDTLIAMEIDSSTTLNENLADIGGIRHAFRAYKRWENNNYREPRLPALSLNPYQLFFVAAVRPYCAVIPNLAKIFLMEMDEHLPNGMRMNGMLMNTPEFAEVFNCSPGSRMVANQTCPLF